MTAGVPQRRMRGTALQGFAGRIPVTVDTLAELRRRRLVPVAAVISAAFVGLFAAGFSAMYSRTAQEASRLELEAATSIMTVMGLFVVHMLTALLALFVAVGAVSGPRSSGMLLPVLARPISRRSWLLQRWTALALVVVGYPLIMTVALLAVAVGIADYAPSDPLRAIGVLALEGIVLVSLAVAASSRWSTVVAGVVVVALVGVAWLAGLVEVIGDVLGNTIMQNIGVVTSLIVPTDALWRGASYYLQSTAFITASDAVGGEVPFAGSAPPTLALLLWSVAYATVCVAFSIRSVARTDL